jgi:hypothetical protein
MRVSATALLLFALLAAGCGGPTASVPGSANTTGRAPDRGGEIIAEYLRREASPFRKDRVRLTIRSEGEPVDIYELDVWRRQTPDETATMSIITKPAKDADSGSLVLETTGKPTVVVTYSAARGEFRETDTGKMFFGGLTVQELLGEWGKYTYRSVGEREVDGRRCLEIEGKLNAAERSIIASNRVLFDAESYIPVEVHLFGVDGKELRTYQRKETRTESGREYLAKTEVKNHVYKSNILIEIVSRELPASIDAAIFSRERLKASAQK